MALRCPSGMTQATLIETCRHNLQTSLLVQIGVAESRTWKQLIQQGEQAEEIIVRVKAEENKPRPEKSTRRMPETSLQSKRKDNLATKIKSPINPQPVRGGGSSSQPRANKRLRKSNDTSRNHPYLQLRFQENLSCYMSERWIIP